MIVCSWKIERTTGRDQRLPSNTPVAHFSWRQGEALIESAEYTLADLKRLVAEKSLGEPDQALFREALGELSSVNKQTTR